MKCVNSLMIVSTIAFSATVSHADIVDSFVVGSGASSSYLQFQFANNNTYLYEVRYDGAVFGDDLITIIAAAQPSYFAYQTISYSFGDAIVGISIGSDSNEGFGTPPEYLDYWHYWTRDDALAAWSESWVGFADRAHSNGMQDGWVFGSNSAPASVPTPSACVVIASMLLTRRRRR